MNPPRIPSWLIACIVLTGVLSLYSISYRYRAEQRNRRVSISLEYENVEAFAQAEGKSISEGLQDLKQQGLSSVTLSEQYVGDLVNSGHASISSAGIAGETPADVQRIQRGLSIRFPALKNVLAPADGASILPVTAISADTIRSTAVGLNPREAAAVRGAGLEIVARLANPQGANSDYVVQALDWAHQLGARIFLPMGDQVLGRRDAVRPMLDELRRLGMYYASAEFSKMGGEQTVLQDAPDLVVRLHSAQSAELDKLRPDEAVERYSLAARERGMRVLLVRPLSNTSPQPLGALADFVRKINDDCRRQGLDMGSPRPFSDPGVPAWLQLLIGLSIVPTACFVISAFVSDPRWRIAGFGLALAIGALSATNHFRPYTALLGALAFPTAAFLILDSRRRPNVVRDFFAVSLISLVGGLSVAGLLNSLPYFIRAQQFEGVKLAVFLPIALIAFYFISRRTDLKETLKSPMTWGAAALGILVLGALMFMSSRTGNDNPAGVSDLELKMRFVLEQVLVVRPRTKEFMVGHPLLVVGIGLLALYRRKPNKNLAVWTALALAGGAIGQTDIVNTMCHIHTPVALSLMRVGVGAVAGSIIGLLVWGIVKRWLPAGEEK